MGDLSDLPVLPDDQAAAYRDATVIFRNHFDGRTHSTWVTVTDWPTHVTVSPLFLDLALDKPAYALVGTRLLIRTLDQWALYRLVARHAAAHLYYARRVAYGSHRRDLRYPIAPVDLQLGERCVKGTPR